MDSAEVLCVGEILWDSLPQGLFLGGAPLNAAGHLRALGTPAAMLGRVGDDRLGTEALRRLAACGLDPDLVQVDPELETGFVSVRGAGGGAPSYEIHGPAAWDRIEWREGLAERAARARALVFGSLAQRAPVSRRTVERLREATPFRVFDVNLRPPHDHPEVVRASLAGADLVKLNEGELRTLAGWFGLPPGLREGMAALRGRFGCGAVCVTRGGEGAALLRGERWSEHPGFRVEVADTVGAGDAFLAALLSGLLAGRDDAALLQHASLVGACVATRHGAIPGFGREALLAVLAANPRVEQEAVRRLLEGGAGGMAPGG